MNGSFHTRLLPASLLDTDGVAPRWLTNAGLQLCLVAIGATGGAAAVLASFLSTAIVKVFLIGMAAVVAALILCGNPRLLCLYGLVTAAPLDMSKRFLVKAHLGGASALRIDLVDLFLLPLMAFLIRDLVAGYRDRRTIRMPSVCVSWITLMVLGLYFVLLGPYRTLAGLEIVRMAKCLLLFLVVVNEVVRLKHIGHFVVALMAAVLLQAGVGLLEYGLNRQLSLQVLGETTEESIKETSHATLITGEPVNRVGALLGHSNLLGAFLALLLPVGVSLLFTQVDLRLRILSFVTVVLGTAVLLATLSRTGWVAYGTALLGVLALGNLHRPSRGRHALRRVVIIAVVGAVVVAFSGPIIRRLYYSDENAVRVRLEWIEVARKMVMAKPVLGHGLNSFVFQMAPYTKFLNDTALTQAYGQQWPVVHNNYAIVWVEQGTIGFLVFMALQVHVISVGVRNFRVRHETLFAINLGALCGLFAMMVDWIASFSLRMDPLGRMYWIQVGLLCAIDHWWRLNRPSDAPAAKMPAASWPDATAARA